MKKQMDQVHSFHEAFKLYSQDNPNMDIPEHIRELWIDLMQEELDEVKEAMREKDINEVGKELADVLFTLLGTVELYGLRGKFEAVFDEVYKSNMSKLDANGQPLLRPNGKVMKSELYKEADIKSVLEQ